MDYYKPKDYLKKEGDKVQIQIVSKGETKEGKYGSVTELDIVVGGKSLRWDAMDKYLQSIKNSGCGATFWMIGYRTKFGSIGYSYAPLGDISANLGQDVSNEVKTPEKPTEDEYQRRVSRGAAWNNAFAHCLEFGAPGDKEAETLEPFLHRVAAVAELIAPHQKAFVNGVPNASVTISGTVEEVPPPTPPPEDHTDLDDSLPNLPF